jgi:hypothetical protein
LDVFGDGDIIHLGRFHLVGVVEKEVKGGASAVLQAHYPPAMSRRSWSPAAPATPRLASQAARHSSPPPYTTPTPHAMSLSNSGKAAAFAAKITHAQCSSNDRRETLVKAAAARSERLDELQHRAAELKALATHSRRDANRSLGKARVSCARTPRERDRARRIVV